MINQKYPKLLSMAILSTLFIFISFRNTKDLPHSGTSGASAVENGITNYRLHQNAKVPGGQVELDYWIRWKNQFVWTLPGKGPALLPGKTGC